MAKKTNKQRGPKFSEQEEKFSDNCTRLNDKIFRLIWETKEADSAKNYASNLQMRINKAINDFVKSQVKPFVLDDLAVKESQDTFAEKFLLKGLLASSSTIADTAYLQIATALKQSGKELTDKVNAYIKRIEKQGKTPTIMGIADYIRRELEESSGLTLHYANGTEVLASAYSQMVARTARVEVSNVQMLNNTLKHNGDLVECDVIFPTCDICAVYQGRVYSISGKDRRFPSLFKTAFKHGYATIHPNCRHSFTPYIEQITDDAAREEKIKQSNRSWEPDTKTKSFQQKEAQREAYAKGQALTRQYNEEFKEYNFLKETLGEKMPYKTIGGFRRASRQKSEELKKLRKEVRRNNKKP